MSKSDEDRIRRTRRVGYPMGSDTERLTPEVVDAIVDATSPTPLCPVCRYTPNRTCDCHPAEIREHYLLAEVAGLKKELNEVFGLVVAAEDDVDRLAVNWGAATTRRENAEAELATLRLAWDEREEWAHEQRKRAERAEAELELILAMSDDDLWGIQAVRNELSTHRATSNEQKGKL